MTNFIHPVTTATTTLKANRHICSFQEQVTTGKKNIDSVVDYIIGSKFKDQAIIHGSVAKGIRQSQRQLIDAQSLLASVQRQLTDLEAIVKEAGKSQGIKLIQLDGLYSKGVIKLIDSLDKANYDWKVFLETQNLPTCNNIDEYSISFNVRVGKNPNNTLPITLPKPRADIALAKDNGAEGNRGKLILISNLCQPL